MSQRNTPQRRQVLAAVRQMHCHPTAEQVWEALQDTGLGRATVYRNLAVLSDQGMLHRLDVPGSPTRYDDLLNPHCHLVCRQCGCFTDVSTPAMLQLDEDAAAASGFREVRHDLIFSGICPACGQAADAELSDPAAEE